MLEIEACLALKEDTSYLHTLFGHPQEVMAYEISYFLKEGCHSTSRELVCERISVTFDSESNLLGRIRLINSIKSH